MICDPAAKKLKPIIYQNKNWTDLTVESFFHPSRLAAL